MKRMGRMCALFLPAASTIGCLGEIAVADLGPSRDGGSADGASPDAGSPDAVVLPDAATATGVAASVCQGTGPAAQVLTLSDIAGQWIAGCDPSSPPIPAVVSGAADTSSGVPRTTAGFEFDPANHLVYALVPSGSAFVRATGPGSVWWANDIYPYGALPDGGPQEYLSITNANLSGGTSYTQMLGGWGVLYHPATGGGTPELTLVDFAGHYTISMLRPAAFLATAH